MLALALVSVPIASPAQYVNGTITCPVCQCANHLRQGGDYVGELVVVLVLVLVLVSVLVLVLVLVLSPLSVSLSVSVSVLVLVPVSNHLPSMQRVREPRQGGDYVGGLVSVSVLVLVLVPVWRRDGHDACASGQPRGARADDLLLPDPEEGASRGCNNWR